MLYLLPTVLFILSTSCTTTPEPIEEFTYIYSMENINNFKIEFELNSDSSYKITQYNYFFDNFEDVKKPILNKGTLNNEEFSIILKLLNESKIFNMKESYGFNNQSNSSSDIIYMIELNRNGKSKYISINSSTAESFPLKFTELIKQTNKIISLKQKKE